MITRAIITDTDLSIGKVKIRIPILEGIGENGDTTWASIIYIPGINVNFQVGDIVEVGFEDNDVGRPIVLGFLKLRNRDIESRVYSTFKELKVEEKFDAPTNTTIGKTYYQDLFDSVDKSKDSTSTQQEANI